MATLEADLDAWCQSYVTAFSAYDAAGIGDHWLFPALIISSGRNLVFKTREHFDANTGGLLDFYKREGVAKAERGVLSCLAMNDDTAAMRVCDAMLDGDGNTIVTWEAAYTLRKTDEGWRAILAAADGELAAWAARGTPLGG